MASKTRLNSILVRIDGSCKARPASTPILNAGQFFITTMPLKGSNIKAPEMVNSSGNLDLKLLEIYGQFKVNVTHHAGGSMLAIPMLSEYPVQAMAGVTKTAIMDLREPVLDLFEPF